MGFWDKVKSVKNMMTGGGAEVFVSTANPESTLGEPVVFNIKAIIKDADLKIDKVYLYVKAIETVVARDVDLAQDVDGEVHQVREDVQNTVETYKTEIMVSGPEVLQANETYEWTTELELPDSVNGTYRGENCTHEWMVYAGLDAFGNDPDSNWQTFEIY